MATLTVSKLAKQVGVQPATIRYYERTGLLPPARRTPNGYRQYDQAVAGRLHLIKGAQRLGLRLREIAELLAIRDRGTCPCRHARALVQRRLGEIDAEIARLVELRHELEHLATECAVDAVQDPDGAWPCEAQFIEVGKEVTTIEHLGTLDRLHPMQQAFIDQDAFQCGYCTPGQIMSGVGCIQEKHAGSAEEIREWMSGNICRCGAYPHIVAAVAQAARTT